jgi:hypothetical protein
MTSDQINELVGALAKAQGEMDNAPMLSENPHFRSKYADLASIRNATVPHLAKNGLALFQSISAVNGSGLLLVTRLAHSSGQWVESAYPIPLDSKPHIMGSAITYARRYSWAAICGIAAEEDDDANAAQEGAKSRPALPARKSSAAAKRDGDWPRFEQALRDCQSAREVEKLRAEYQSNIYPAWNQDWQATAEQEFAKRLAEFSAPGNLKQTLQDSLQEALEPVDDDAATNAQVQQFHECWEYLEGAGTLTDIVARTDNPGYREGLKMLTPDQLAQLRAFYKARREELGKAAA